MRKKSLLCIVLMMTLLLFTGCTKEEKNNDMSLHIVTSFYPMYIATSNIVDGISNVDLVCLASPSVGCLHDYQLTVNDMMTLEKADVFVINGGGMESFLDKAVSAYPKLSIINASDGIIEMHEEEHEEKHEGGEHHHEENSHIWVSISMYIEEVKNIAQKLGEYDLKNAEKYQKNAEEYIQRLEKLKEDMHNQLDSVTHKDIVTFHEAFDFFAEEFGLHIKAVIEREPGTYPSAREVAEIIKLIQSKEVNAIFTEPQYAKTAATTIAKETGVSVFELDPVVTGELEKDAYEKAMRKNLAVLKEALQ